MTEATNPEPEKANLEIRAIRAGEEEGKKFLESHAIPQEFRDHKEAYTRATSTGVNVAIVKRLGERDRSDQRRNDHLAYEIALKYEALMNALLENDLLPIQNEPTVESFIVPPSPELPPQNT